MPIDVSGELQLVGPTARPVRLRARGSALNLAVPGWAELFALGPRNVFSRRRAVAASIRSLDALRLTLYIEIAGHRALALGAGVNASLLARLLGFPHFRVRLSGVLASLFR